MDEPERRITDARPAQAARCAAEAKAQQATSVRVLPAVLTPTPGQDRVKGVSKAPQFYFQATSSLCLRSVMSWS